MYSNYYITLRYDDRPTDYDDHDDDDGNGKALESQFFFSFLLFLFRLLSQYSFSFYCDFYSCPHRWNTLDCYFHQKLKVGSCCNLYMFPGITERRKKEDDNCQSFFRCCFKYVTSFIIEKIKKSHFIRSTLQTFQIDFDLLIFHQSPCLYGIDHPSIN